MYRRKHKRKSAVPRDRKSTSFGEATVRYAQDKNPAHQGGRGVSTMTLEQPPELTSRPVPAHTPERGGVLRGRDWVSQVPIQPRNR